MKESISCPECGNEVSNSQKFCENCGKKLKNPQNDKKTNKESKNKNNKKNFAIIGIILIILLIVLTAALSSFNTNSNQLKPDTYQSSLSELKTNYTNLEAKFNATRTESLSSQDKSKEDVFISAQLELIRANSAIEDVETALKIGKSQGEIDKLIKIAKEKLNNANQAYNNI